MDTLRAEVGDVVSLDKIESALKSKQYKIITVTHVDTSTGTFPNVIKSIDLIHSLAVLSDIESIASLVKKVSPGTLVRYP